MRRVTLVTGPPCAGKSTWVQQHARPGDHIVCFDQLARAAGSPNRHRHTREQRAAAGAAYRRLCAHLPDHVGTAWVIRCAPTAHERGELARQIEAGAVIVLIPPIRVALARAQAARRETRIHTAIHRWYATYQPCDGDTVVTHTVPTW